MKCLILAAGYATRLYPLTENFPKPLLSVGEKTILDWLIEDIDSAQTIDEYIVISNHKFAAQFHKWAEERKGNARVSILDDGTTDNESRLGAVCDIQLAITQRHLENEDLLVIAGDNVLDFSLTGFISYARAKGTSCVMRFYEQDRARLHKCGILEIDEASDLVKGMEEKPANPKSHWCCPPFYYYIGKDIARIPQAIASGCGTDAPGSLIAWIADTSQVYAMPMPGKRYDIGNLESYHKVQSEYKGIVR